MFVWIIYFLNVNQWKWIVLNYNCILFKFWLLINICTNLVLSVMGAYKHSEY